MTLVTRWRPVSKFIKDHWLNGIGENEYPIAQYHNDQDLDDEHNIDVISTSAKQNATTLPLFEGRTLDYLLSKVDPEGVTELVFPKLELNKEKLKNGELGMVYFPMSLGDLIPKYVLTSHDLKKVRCHKADVYGILSKKSYPNLDKYPPIIRAVSQFEGLTNVGQLDHYPQSLYECCKFMSVAGVPAAIADTKVRISHFLLAMTFTASFHHVITLTNVTPITFRHVS